MTSDLLYASLLMSLLAAFVAMLGKQWLNRYIRHAGGSMVERCGDRQRKFDGIEKWPFRLFVESLPIMLQIALLLLTCGLSRYMWSVNTSVASVILSFTVLGFLFYLGIVAAGASSYECPFQTPASMALRGLKDRGIAGRLSAGLFVSNITPLILYSTQTTARKLLPHLSLPNVTSLFYATWMDVRLGIISAPHRVYEAIQHPPHWIISPSYITSGIRRGARRLGHQIITFLRVDRALGNAGQRLVQGVQRLARATPLPSTLEDVTGQPLVPKDGPCLWLRVRNFGTLRRQNGDNARCVSWVLRNVTDPEAIDSAISLAGIIRWFDGDPTHDPPFGFIVSVFEACFDSTKQVYPGMRNRAYFSARAILQIHVMARVRSNEHGLKYPIPAISSGLVEHTDPNLQNILCMLRYEPGNGRSTLHFPDPSTHTLDHTLWMSNLFADLTRVATNPILAFHPYESRFSAVVTSSRAVIANFLVMWCMFLGGHIHEETFWVVDKSYVAVLLSFPVYSMFCILVIRWKPSSPTCLRGLWISLPTSATSDTLTISWEFWQHGRNGLSG